eukprot:m.327082 g.327082  ORF g.327082 m.327082 type:complete len:85 (-) comp20412_c1_seq12:162-416(-)
MSTCTCTPTITYANMHSTMHTIMHTAPRQLRLTFLKGRLCPCDHTHTPQSHASVCIRGPFTRCAEQQRRAVSGYSHGPCCDGTH